MSRGRRNPPNVPLPSAASPGASARGGTLVIDGLRASLDAHAASATLLQEANAAIARATGRDAGGFPPFGWADHHNVLHSLCQAALLEALAAGDLAQARSVCAEYGRLGGGAAFADQISALPERAFEPARALAGALAAIDDLLADERFEPWPSGPGRRSFLARAHELGAVYETMRARVAAEDRTTPWRPAFRDTTRAWELVHEDLDAIRAAARARLRHHDVEGLDQVEIHLRASPEALAALAAAHAGSPAFTGLRVEHDRVWDSRGTPAKGKVALSLAAELVATVGDERRVRILARSAIGEVRTASDATLRRRGEAFAAEHGITGSIGDAVREAPGWIEPEDFDVPAGAPPVDREALLGRDACRHDGASWRDSGHGEALLVCDRCFRGAAAAVPRHRLPDSHPLSLTVDEDPRYLRQAAARASLLGEPAPPASLADLRARDGEASVRPRDYAIGMAPMSAPARTGGLAAALSRRPTATGSPLGSPGVSAARRGRAHPGRAPRRGSGLGRRR